MHQLEGTPFGGPLSGVPVTTNRAILLPNLRALRRAALAIMLSSLVGLRPEHLLEVSRKPLDAVAISLSAPLRRCCPMATNSDEKGGVECATRVAILAGTTQSDAAEPLPSKGRSIPRVLCHIQ